MNELFEKAFAKFIDKIDDGMSIEDLAKEMFFEGVSVGYGSNYDSEYRRMIDEYFTSRQD